MGPNTRQTILCIFRIDYYSDILFEMDVSASNNVAPLIHSASLLSKV